MKKNFFKKLSFVLALAMVVSVIAPAAGAFAAVATKLNSTTRYLYLGEDGKNEFDFNVINKVKGTKYSFESSNENVAVVDAANGVATATAVGKATITLYANGKATKVSATVYVRSNISEITTVYMQTKDAPATDKLKVNTEYDFGRTYKTADGASTGTTSVTRWFVDKADKASVSDLGVFKATEAGTYKLTAVAFATTAKYDAWKALKDTTSTSGVLSSKTIDVTVVTSLTAVKLVTPTQIELTFDSSVKDVVKAAADVKVDLKLNDTLTAQVPVWTFDSVSADGKVVTVSTYEALVDKKIYKVTAAGSVFELYAQIGAPASIEMADQTIAANTATTVAYKLFDANGVDVKSVYDSAVVKNSTVPIANGKITLANDQVAFVEFNYTIQNSDGTSKTISTGTHTIKGVAATVGSVLEWNVNTSEDFTKTTKSVKANDTSEKVYGRIKKSDSTYTATAEYKYVSLTPSVLLIDEVTDALVPVAAGTALVKVLDSTNTVVTYINIDVIASPATQTIKASTSNLVLSNSIMDGALETYESGTVTIKQVDQYNVETAVALQDAYVVNTNKTTDLATIVKNDAAGTITFTANNDKAGTFTYYVKAADKTLTFTVTVATPGTLSSYAINANNASIDANTANADTASSTDFTVFSVDAAGVKKAITKDLTAISGAAVTYTITDGDGVTKATGTFNGTASYSVDDADGTVEKAGTYTFTVNIGGIKYVKTFAVVNTRAALTATTKALSVTVANGTSVSTAALSLITLKSGDTELTDASKVNVTFVTSNSSVLPATGVFGSVDGTITVFISKITYQIAPQVTQEVTINKSFTITVQ